MLRAASRDLIYYRRRYTPKSSSRATESSSDASHPCPSDPQAPVRSDLRARRPSALAEATLGSDSLEHYATRSDGEDPSSVSAPELNFPFAPTRQPPSSQTHLRSLRSQGVLWRRPPSSRAPARDVMQLSSCLLLASILRTGGRRYVASPPSGCDSRFLEPFWGLVLAAGTENHSSN